MLELLEKFLLTLTPQQAHAPLHNAFLEIKNEPIVAMGRGFHLVLPDVKSEGSKESFAAINGILLGIALANGCQPHTPVEAMLREYIDHHKKGQGDNVVSFVEARIGKKI